MKNNNSCFLVSVLFFALFSITLPACGGGTGNPGSEGLDKTWGIITAEIMPGVEVSDYKNFAAQGRSVDVFQNHDCDGNPESNDPELFTEHPARVNITLTPSNDNIPTAEHIIEGYRIDYTTETPGAPPIQSFTSGSQTIVLKPDTETSFYVVMVDISRKIKLAEDLTYGQYQPQYQYPTYTAIYTFYGKDIHGNSFQTVVQTNFDVGDYDYCSL
ncbi:MAG: hypothetical protein IBX72_13350 [Nitrospirae bacterium]|nr:hypothetical protein [Nitrospirota bacterium]